MKKLTDKQIQKQYEIVKEYHKKHLAPLGIKLPHLLWGGKYTIDALTLVCLSQNYPNTTAVTKEELTKFIKMYKPDAGDDIQSGRHLGKQKGWYIITGTRGDDFTESIPEGSYKLVTLEDAYPKFSPDRRGSDVTDEFWDNLKRSYDYRCACCGSKENEPHRYYPSTITTLQKGHKNPNLPLTVDNIIPQCENCNRPDLNNWEYNDEGRVVRIAKVSVIDGCSKEMKKEIYAKLFKLFKGKKPSEL